MRCAFKGTGLTFFELAPATPQYKALWHRTATVDYVVVQSGSFVLMLDSGEVVLRPGDVVIQRNTRHAWRNPSTTERATAWVTHVSIPGP